MPVVPTHHYRETYTADALDELAATFRIPVEHRAEMTKHLEDAAAIWRWNIGRQTKRQRPTQTARALSRIEAQARKLSQTVLALPDEAFGRLDAAIANGQSEAVAAMIKEQPISSMPALASPETDSDNLGMLLDLSDILQIIGALQKLAKEAAQMPSGSSGAKRDYALRMWIINIEMFWISTLGRVFSRDATSSGEPLSEAAQFCVAAFKIVNPATPSSRVLNEMKHRIRETSR